LDPIVVMNLVFDLVILALAIFVRMKRRIVLILWIAIAFGFFAVSYILTIVGLSSPLILTPVRAVGYLSVIAGLVLQSKS